MPCKDCINCRYDSEASWWAKSPRFYCDERDGKSIDLDDDDCYAFHKIEPHQELTGEYCKKCGTALRKCDKGSDFHNDGRCFNCREEKAKQDSDFDRELPETVEVQDSDEEDTERYP